MQPDVPKLTGRVALITGAGSGIGRATACRLGQEGAQVAVLDRDDEAAADTVAILSGIGVEASSYRCDVRNEHEVQLSIEAVLNRYSRIDILHNNAGVMVAGTAITLSLADWDLTYGVNVRGMFLVCRVVIPHMQQQGSGAIVNTASVSGLVGEPNLVAYDSSKAAVINLTRQLAVEYARDGIRCNCICPGMIDTAFNEPWYTAAGIRPEDIPGRVNQFVPMNRRGSAEEVASVVAFLVSDDAAYITGHALVVDGGLTAQ